MALTLTSSTDILAISLSVAGVILSSVVLAYVSQTYQTCNGQPQQDPVVKNTGIFLIVISSLILAASVAYWILLGYRNSTGITEFFRQLAA